MKKILAVLAVPALAIGLGASAEAAPSRGSGATLAVSTSDGARVTSASAAKAGSMLVFSGCGYAPGTGVTVVVVSPTATSFFGGPADANGCYSSANYEAYFAEASGAYTAKAFQSSNKRADASVSFSVAP